MLLARSLSLAASSFILATAQYETPEDIPLCAYNPIQSVINGLGCQVTETTCFCAKPGVVSSFASAVVPACNGEVSSAEVSSFASSFCVITSSATSTSSCQGPTPTRADAPKTPTTSRAASTTNSGASSTSPRTSGTETSSPAASATQATPSATATPSDQSTGSPNLGVSALALAIAIGAMTWVFGELEGELF